MDTAPQAPEAPKIAPPGRDGLLTRTELAGHFGVTRGTITRWEKDGMPVGEKAGRGKETLFNLAAVEKWKKESDESGADGFLSLERARTRLAIAQAEKVERDNRVAAGELIAIDEMVSIGQIFVKAIVAKVRAIPRRLVQIDALPRDKEADAAAICREVLTEVSSWQAMKDLELAAKGLAPKAKRARKAARAS